MTHLRLARFAEASDDVTQRLAEVVTSPGPLALLVVLWTVPAAAGFTVDEVARTLDWTRRRVLRAATMAEALGLLNRTATVWTLVAPPADLVDDAPPSDARLRVHAFGDAQTVTTTRIAAAELRATSLRAWLWLRARDRKWSSHRQLTERLGVTSSTTSRALAGLCEAGALTVLPSNPRGASSILAVVRPGTLA